MTGKLIAAITGEWALAHSSPMLGKAGYNIVDFGIASERRTLQHSLCVARNTAQIIK